MIGEIHGGCGWNAGWRTLLSILPKCVRVCWPWLKWIEAFCTLVCGVYVMTFMNCSLKLLSLGIHMASRKTIFLLMTLCCTNRVFETWNILLSEPCKKQCPEDICIFKVARQGKSKTVPGSREVKIKTNTFKFTCFRSWTVELNV